MKHSSNVDDRNKFSNGRGDGKWRRNVRHLKWKKYGFNKMLKVKINAKTSFSIQTFLFSIKHECKFGMMKQEQCCWYGTSFFRRKKKTFSRKSVKSKYFCLFFPHIVKLCWDFVLIVIDSFYKVTLSCIPFAAGFSQYQQLLVNCKTAYSISISSKSRSIWFLSNISNFFNSQFQFRTVSI